MERQESEKDAVSTDDANLLNRNRSFKSKQLVRSQAIRETQSPPRTISPAVDPPHHNQPTSVNVMKKDNNPRPNNMANVDEAKVDMTNVEVTNVDVTEVEVTSGEVTGAARTVNVDNSSHCSTMFSDCKSNSDCNDDVKKKQMVEIQITHLDDVCLQQRSRRRYRTAPRVMCVCAQAYQSQRRGRRRAQCPAKQDSGIACADDCPDCMDNGAPNGDGLRKSASLDADESPYYYRKQKSLTRMDSDDRQEMSAQELVCFIKETLNKSAKDRSTLLKVEKDLLDLVCDKNRCSVRFGVMSSYQRMLVHRCAALFQLRHHLDPASRVAVCVTKTGTIGGCVPCSSFSEWCTVTFLGAPTDLEHSNSMELRAKSILKRDAQSLDESCATLSAAKSRSLQQREKDYERVRRRIFSTEKGQDEAQWPWLSGQVKLLTPDAGRNKLLKVQSLEMGAGAAPCTPSRGAVSKSHSFGGYAVEAPAARLLSRQGDLASSSWRLSPSSSGYKTLSLRSTDSVTPSPTGGASPEPTCDAVVWAVTDLASVPAGALVIHPQTGRPLTNPDGSPYHFDPDNPPPLNDANTYTEHKTEQLDMRRGRLEKQHSFIDNDTECPTNDECRAKCCCECRKHEGHQEKNKIPIQPEPKASKPATPQHSPKKEIVQIEPQRPHSANQRQENQHQFEPTNQKPPPDQRHYENRYEPRTFDSSKVYEVNQLKTQRPVESQEMQYGIHPGYMPEYNNGVISPAQYVSAEQHKLSPAPAHMHDPNIRPMSLTNVVYQTPVQPVYPYVNHVRMDGQIQQLYQPVIQNIEEHKQLVPSPHNNDNTFRIDPSYPYPAVDYSHCGACTNVCVDPNMQHQRGYNMQYHQVELPQMLPAQYPLGNVILPHQHLQPYPYQEALHWQNAQRVMPVYPTICPPYRIYPQVLPQPYPVCQPMFPDKPPEVPMQQHKPSHTTTERNTPAQTPPTEKVPCDEPKPPPIARQNSNEIALKIQQIKDQMAQLNTKEKRDSDVRGRRNSGGGILGSYPTAYGDGRQMNDEGQLSSAARAIVNSIRNMQARTHTYNDQRHDFRPDHRQDREFRRRQDRVEDKDRVQERGESEGDRRYGGRPPFQYRPPYLLRQMSPGTWCRRSPGPVHPAMNQPRRPHPDSRNWRR